MMNAPRILHCLRAPVGGLFRHVRDLAIEQARRGFDVGVLCDDQAVDSLTEQRLAELGSKISLGVHRVSMSRGLGLTDFTAFRTARNLVQALQIDVAHGHGAKGGAHARLAGRALRSTGQRVTTVYTPHGGSLNYKPGTPASRLFLGLERQLIPVTDAIVFESAYAQKRYHAGIGGQDLRQQVIFNGLLAEEFAPPVVNADATDLLFIGELRRVKGVDVLLNAMSIVRQSRPVSLTIVGEGAERNNLAALCRELGLEDTVRFVGAKPAREAFRLGRTMVVPSRAESFPYVVLEAAAAGMPLISTDVGGIPEIVEGSDTGLILCDDVGGLASAIRHVLGDFDGALARAQRLKTIVGRRFTVDTMTDDICALYQESALAAAA